MNSSHNGRACKREIKTQESRTVNPRGDCLPHLQPEEQTSGFDEPSPHRDERPFAKSLANGRTDLGPILIQVLEHRLEDLKKTACDVSE